MKRVFCLLTLCLLCISSYAWDVSVGVHVKSNKKWHVTTNSDENCKTGKGLCFVITGTIESASLSGSVITYQEGSDQITLSVEEGSEFFEGMDASKNLLLSENSPVLTELNSTLGLPENSFISEGRYVPEHGNGRYYYSLKLK